MHTFSIMSIVFFLILGYFVVPSIHFCTHFVHNSFIQKTYLHIVAEDSSHNYADFLSYESVERSCPQKSSFPQISGLNTSCFFSSSLPMNPSWPEHPVLSRQISLSSYHPARQPVQQSMSLDFGHHSPSVHQSHIHPAPNAHSSPRSSQRSRVARQSLGRSPAQSFDEQDDSSLGYGTDCPSSVLSLLGNGSTDRELLATLDVPMKSQLSHLQPPLLPEKKRASDGEHSLGTASPSPSGFSSPHSGSSLSIPFPNILPDLSAQMLGPASPLPGKPLNSLKIPCCTFFSVPIIFKNNERMNEPFTCHMYRNTS